MSELDDDDEAYEVSDEMLASYARSTPLQRLEWLEQMRTFSYRAVTEETRARWRERRDRARGLDVPGVDLDLTNDEIVALVHEGRRPA